MGVTASMTLKSRIRTLDSRNVAGILPGSDPELMYSSLQMLSALPDDTVVYPGHMYSASAEAAMVELREDNYIFKPKTRDAWMQYFGGKN